MDRGFSIIICTYNGGDLLPQTLDHIKKQDLKNLPIEVIIVDNNSDAYTKSVLQNLKKKMHMISYPELAYCLDL